MNQERKDAVYFIHDGECPICNGAANAFAIKQAVGNLILIDARTQGGHPVMAEINKLGLNIDEGMVIKLKDTIYHGADALHMMALIGSNSGVFNRINYFFFRSKILSKSCYPVLKGIRNLFLKLMGISKINR